MGRLRTLYSLLRAADDLSERHRPLNPPRDWMEGIDSIDSYLQRCRQRVTASRIDLDTQQRDWVIDGNSPFLLQPAQDSGARRTVLMVHGLSDAPFMMRDIADWFQAQGFRVLSMQLPGHGTRPGDLLDIHWQDGLAAQRQLIELLAEDGDELYLLGFSLGAVLNLYQALLEPRFSALFLFAPAIRISPLVRATCSLAASSRWWQRAAWFDVQPDTDSFKYESLTNRSLCEVSRLIEAQQRLTELTELNAPLFVVASETDATINSSAILDWFASQHSPYKRMLYYSCGQPDVPDGVEVLPACLPQQNIKSYAHTSLLQSAESPHYGRDGAQRFCTHYYRIDPDKYRRCKAGEEDCLGEMFDESPECQVIRRLTWNPGFDTMLEKIRSFLDHLKK